MASQRLERRVVGGQYANDFLRGVDSVLFGWACTSWMAVLLMGTRIPHHRQTAARPFQRHTCRGQVAPVAEFIAFERYSSRTPAFVGDDFHGRLCQLHSYPSRWLIGGEVSGIVAALAVCLGVSIAPPSTELDITGLR